MHIHRLIAVTALALSAVACGEAADTTEPTGAVTSHEDESAPDLDDTAAKAGMSCRTLNDVIRATYRLALLREPDPGGASYWLLQLQAGMPPLQMLENVVRSQEFTSSRAGLTDVQFVTGLYGGLLDRAPDAGGFAYWMSALQAQPSTRTNVALSFVDSAEFASDGLHACFF